MDYVLDNYVYFGSSAKQPNNLLSNFAMCKVVDEENGLVFPSSEHWYCSQKVIASDRKRFTVDGDLGVMTPEAFLLIYPACTIRDKKFAYWSKKNNIGILAKMAVSTPTMMRRLGLRPAVSMDETDALWMTLLLAKFRQNPHIRQVLLCTLTAKLVEFDRGAQRNVLKGTPVLWGGLIKEGHLYGENRMGNLLMKCRTILAKESA